MRYQQECTQWIWDKYSVAEFNFKIISITKLLLLYTTMHIPHYKYQICTLDLLVIHEKCNTTKSNVLQVMKLSTKYCLVLFTQTVLKHCKFIRKYFGSQVLATETLYCCSVFSVPGK